MCDKYLLCQQKRLLTYSRYILCPSRKMYLAHDDRFSYNTPGTEKEFWRAMAVPLCQRESPLRSHGECARVASPPPHPNTHTKWQSIHCARLLIGPLMHVGMQHSINGCRLISETDVGTSKYACGLAMAIPCRQRAAQSPLWSHNRGVTAAMVGRGRSRGSRPS